MRHLGNVKDACACGGNRGASSRMDADKIATSVIEGALEIPSKDWARTAGVDLCRETG